MTPLPTIHAVCLLSLLVVSSANAAWSSRDDKEDDFSPRQQGEIVFVSPSGALDSAPSLTYDTNDNVVKMDKFSANTFYGDSLNFRGREIRNAALVDCNLEGLKQLTVRKPRPFFSILYSRQEWTRPRNY
eukprot:g4513.t1 g4513   contig15:1182362-1182751(-)